ncbi:hypothetical protein GCM10010924_51580 [Rhizobium wenxiniae]|uniref:Uncharacterized protein n=1 Tax=Rhizobium wenxiniae TaxID=1737357 RepID=A0A7W9YBZ1_9HYPH|nr:hypothetical protein [Rhizobium wenxiniae]MBB6165740.1 hypothetical protein [Rhizobium wenxiniae]GGG16257.1 hypothetical protein GCM10010924_51580 [Rhizobium wenxiniae]
MIQNWRNAYKPDTTIGVKLGDGKVHFFDKKDAALGAKIGIGTG